jgi:hypothetical protein
LKISILKKTRSCDVPVQLDQATYLSGNEV